jgi:ABC-type multidrug transport system permease subunit
VSGLFDFRGAAAVIYKELRQMIRSPITIALALGMPIMQMLILGYAINTTVEHVPAAVLNEDRGRGAQAFLDVLTGSRTFDVAVVVKDRAALRDAIVSGKARIAFDIPPNFTADLVAGRAPAVGAYIDGSDSAISQVAYGSAIALGGLPLRDLTAGSPVSYEVRPVVLFNPSMRSANFFVPGLIGLIMQNITLMLTALSIVGELERGTLDQLLVTPIGTAGLMIGKLVPYALLMSVDYVLMLFTLRFVFGVPIAGNVVLLTVLAISFLLTALGLGLFISTVAKTQIQAQLMAIFILLPSVLLSGAVFERSLMPLPMQIVGYFIPLTYFMEILRGIIIRGAGLAELWPWVLPMLGYGIAIFVLASIRFARSTRYS